MRRASRPWGFAASPDIDHYDALWVRDAALAVLGAVASGDIDLVETASATIRTVMMATPSSGHVPAVIWDDATSWDWGEGGVIDASAWFVVASAELAHRTPGSLSAAEVMPSVETALRFLLGLDLTGTGLISSPPSTDWMDSSLVRYGRTLHLNGLYLWALRSAARLGSSLAEKRIPKLVSAINALFWPEAGVDLADSYPGGFIHSALVDSHRRLAAIPREHYVSHVVHSAFYDRCDVLANALAVIADAASPARAGVVIDFLERVGVSRPFPSRTLDRAVQMNDPMWLTEVEETLDIRWHNPPHTYHNAGIWPYIGALHAAAAARAGRGDLANGLLAGTARANAVGNWRFSEWLHGVSGEPAGASSQTWNAGAFLYSYREVNESLK